MTGKGDNYICSMCRRTFTKGWSEEEALAEKSASGFDQFECSIVCDDCYHKVMDEILQ